MKKKALILILLLQTIFVFGQQDCIMESKSGIKRCWGSWKDFNGVQVSIRGPYNEGFNMIYDEKNKNSFRWSFRFKPSNPSKAYHFLITATDNTGKSEFFGGVTFPCNSQKPNESNHYFRTFSNSEIINVNITEIVELTAEVGSQNPTGTAWFDCNGKGWYDSTTNSKNKTSNQQTKSQNDLSEYNRSKADLERQMAEKNAEGQQKSQNYTNAMNAGISAHNSGNYAEAKNQFSIALNNCNTNEARQKAQEYYNKSVDAEKKNQYNNNLNEANVNLQNKDYNGAIQSFGNAMNSATNKAEKRNATTGVVASGVAGVFDILAKDKEEKLEKQRIEQEKQQLKQIKLQDELDLVNYNWSEAKILANQGNYNEAINLMKSYIYTNKLNAYSLGEIGSWYNSIKDFTNAKKCYEKALGIDKKSSAMHYMGDLYQFGNGVKINFETALSYYKQSCENNDKTGCENYKKLKPLVEALAIEKIKKINTVNLSVGTIMPFYKNGKFGFQDVITKEPKIKEQFSIVGEFSNGLALAKLDDKYGYLDKLGNIAIPFIYTKAYDFIDEVAVVATNTRIVNGNTYSCDYEIIDMTGKTIAKYFLMYDFKEGLARARNADNKWGYIDAKANIVIPFTIEGYDGADDFNDGLAKVKVFDGKYFKYGYIDKTGSMVIPAQYDSMSESFYEGMAKIEIKDKYGFINKSGDLIVPPKYTRNYFGEFSEGLASVKKGEKYGFIDKTGTEVISLMYDGAGKFSEGLAYVRLKDKLGFIDKEGTVIIALIYDGCSAFKDGLANVKVNGKWGCINRSGKEIIPFKYDKLGGFENGLALIKLNDKTGMIDKNGNEYW